MKRNIAAMLVLLLLLSTAAGCGLRSSGQAAPTAPAATETPAVPADTASAQSVTGGEFGPEGSVLFDKDGVKVTTAGLDTDPTEWDAHPMIWVDLENTSDEEAYLGIHDGTVNGWMSMIHLADFTVENGEYTGADYDTSMTLAPHSSRRCGLTYIKSEVPGVDMDTLERMEFCFALAEDEYSWPNYFSDRVAIITGQKAEAVDIATLGQVVIDNEKLRLVLGQQDYDDWFGPQVDVYVENKTDRYLGLSAQSAEGDGVTCDYLYADTQLAPRALDAGVISFDGELRQLKGFESLTIQYNLMEADSLDALSSADALELDPITVTYPPQIWGEYESDGLRLEVKPRINDLITMKTSTEDGMLFSAYETASQQAGGYDGAGWLCSIGTVTEDELHEMLCGDMFWADVFAKDVQGRYYLRYHPTDVRYERATPEEMERDMDQWTMLCQWANDVAEKLVEENGLEGVTFSNSEVDMYLARAAWGGAKATIRAEEYGPVEVRDVNATLYAEYLLHCYFWEADPSELPEEAVVTLELPEENVQLDFFPSDGYVRMVTEMGERLYQAGWYDDNVTPAEAMRGWYYALAESQGLKPQDRSLTPFLGNWHEKIAGRGMIAIQLSPAPGKVQIHASWPESAAVMDTWELCAAMDSEGKLAYENGRRVVTEFNESGEGWSLDDSSEESGWFTLNEAGELCWHDDRVEAGEDSVFARN